MSNRSFEPTTMIIDGNHMLHRVLHMDNLRVMQTTTGISTGGIYGSVMALKKALGVFPSVGRCCVVWDHGHSSRRKELLPTYKERKPTEEKAKDKHESHMDLFRDQQRRLKPLLATLGVRQFSLEGREADDVIYRLCEVTPGSVVVTEDRDLFQVVTLPTTMVYRPTADEYVDLDNFFDKAGCIPDHFILKKSIAGDKSDCIPGIPGVGEKTVLKVMGELSKYGDLPTEELLEKLIVSCDTMSEVDKRNRNRYAKIPGGLGIIRKNWEIMDLSLEPFSETELTAVGSVMRGKGNYFNEQDTILMLQSLEFSSVIRSWSSWAGPFRRLG